MPSHSIPNHFIFYIKTLTVNILSSIHQTRGHMRQTVKVEIQGTRTVLFHTFPIHALTQRNEKAGTTGNNAAEWKDTVLMDDKRRLYFLNTYFLGCIKEGGKYVKVGKANLSKKVAATIEIGESKIFLKDRVVPKDEELLSLDTEPVYLDVRAVVNPMTKGKNIRYRVAASKGWECEFLISWDDYVISKEQLKICIENGGSLVGVGDGRAIGFGRFNVTSFKSV